MEYSITKRQKELLKVIYDFIKSTGFPPSFEEMREKLKVSSNQSVLDLLNKLQKARLIKRREGSARNLSILPLGFRAIGEASIGPVLGATSAGPMIEAIETTGEWKKISPDVSRLEENLFMLKIFGDSMINAGIDDGDTVLVKESKEFVSGDIVLACKDGEATVKRFISEDKPPYVYLKPENPAYKNILFTDDTELKGKIISVLKINNWKLIK